MILSPPVARIACDVLDVSVLFAVMSGVAGSVFLDVYGFVASFANTRVVSLGLCRAYYLIFSLEIMEKTTIPARISHVR